MVGYTPRSITLKREVNTAEIIQQRQVELYDYLMEQLEILKKDETQLQHKTLNMDKLLNHINNTSNSIAGLERGAKVLQDMQRMVKILEILLPLIHEEDMKKIPEDIMRGLLPVSQS